MMGRDIGAEIITPCSNPGLPLPCFWVQIAVTSKPGTHLMFWMVDILGGLSCAINISIITLYKHYWPTVLAP